MIFLTQILLLVILGFAAYSLYLVFKLKGLDPFRNWDRDNVNGNLFLIFLIVGSIAAVWGGFAYADLYVFGVNPASEEGELIDGMMARTNAVSIFATSITVFLLFFFAWKYRAREGRKATYYPHNNKLELIWTLVPAVVMAFLIGDGIINWNKIMQPDEEEVAEAMHIEIYGRQFDWTIRYQGTDQEFGRAHVKYITATNYIGLDTKDGRGKDDIVVQEVHMYKGKRVKIHIRAQDVLHSVTMAHFRMKMDAVPGMPTSMSFVPSLSTKEMRDRRNDPDFEYEMSCQQICGTGHYNMRRVIVVHDTKEEFDEWLNSQQSYTKMLGLDNVAQK